jgi:hypothetical protein
VAAGYAGQVSGRRGARVRYRRLKSLMDFGAITRLFIYFQDSRSNVSKVLWIKEMVLKI